MFDSTSWRLSRRRFLGGAVLLSGAVLLPRGPAQARDAIGAGARGAIRESPLIYVSPLRKDGSESACHGEVWFVPDAGDVLVVTAADRWRARAIGDGLDRARLWVGDFGVWKKAGERFRSAPSFVARAELVSGSGSEGKANAALIDRALASFGEKYSDEWDKWGPRFRNGLADGSRVLIRYVPAAA